MNEFCIERVFKINMMLVYITVDGRDVIVASCYSMHSTKKGKSVSIVYIPVHRFN